MNLSLKSGEDQGRSAEKELVGIAFSVILEILLERLCVSGAAVVPTCFPTCFAPCSWRISDTAV